LPLGVALGRRRRDLRHEGVGRDRRRRPESEAGIRQCGVSVGPPFALFVRVIFSFAAAARKVRAFFRELFACKTVGDQHLFFWSRRVGVELASVIAVCLSDYELDDHNIILIVGGKINRFLSEIKTDLVVVVCVRDAFL